MEAYIKYKSVLAKFKDLKQRNYAFNHLDRQSQRLEIAWDALQLVLNQEVKAFNGGYWSSSILNSINRLGPESTQNFFLNKLHGRGCRVCQRGLMMVSQIRLGNELSARETDNGLPVSAFGVTTMSRGDMGIIKGFSMTSFLLIEREYEHGEFHHPYGCHTEEKLANICCNILVNGNFKPKDTTDYLKPKK